MRRSNGWAEQAKEILEREQETVLPFRLRGRVPCDCTCHQYCHTCGNPFVGNQPHINCYPVGSGQTGSVYGV